MVKKLFALASITALCGLTTAVAASGCSSTTEVEDGGTTPETGVPDVIKAEAKAPVDPPEEDAGPETCPPPGDTQITSADIEKALKWVAPKAIQTVCDQKNIDDLRALFAEAAAKTPPTGVKYTDIEAKLGATCSPCVFTNAATSPEWQMYIKGTNGYIDNSAGSCFSAAKDPACGKARFQWERCTSAACNASPESCGTDDATKIRNCKGKAQTGVCKDITNAYTTACPDEAALIETCGNIFKSIAVLCGGGPDGGLDASASN